MKAAFFLFLFVYFVGFLKVAFERCCWIRRVSGSRVKHPMGSGQTPSEANEEKDEKGFRFLLSPFTFVSLTGYDILERN